MDDANIPQVTPVTDVPSGTEHQPVPTGQLQTIAAACAAMKDEIATEAQQMISGAQKTGKHPTFTEACSVMKDKMANEAQHIVGITHRSDKPAMAAPINYSLDTANLDSERPQRKELEQAKRALKEANWFEQ